MDAHHFDLLVRARGLAETKALIERAIADLVAEATAADLCKTDLADALRIDRSTLYRRYVWPADQDGFLEANLSEAKGGS
jgi:hypothetical protein